MNEQYAIVEVFGHRSHAGLVSEVEIFGGKMCKIVTPALPSIPETSRAEVRRGNRWDDDNQCYTAKEESGRYVRAAVESVGSVEHLYGGSAIFSVTACTEAEAIAFERAKHGQGREVWIPDVAALPWFEEQQTKRFRTYHDSLAEHSAGEARLAAEGTVVGATLDGSPDADPFS